MTDKQPVRTLGEQLREARVANGLTLRELARRVQRAPSYLNDIEYDRRVPSEGVLRQICEVLGLDFEQMLAIAGRLGAETESYLKRQPTAGVLFRRVTQERLGEDELKKLIEAAEDLVRKRPASQPDKEGP